MGRLSNIHARWKVIPIAGLLAISVIGGATTVGASPAAKPAVKASKDNLRVVYPVEPVNLNPVKQANSFGNFWQPIMDPLIAQTASFQITNTGLITKWKQTNATTWRFTLRSGVKFSNGEKWDAKAAAFTIQTYKDTVGAPMRSYLLKITELKAVNATTLDIVTSAADSSMPSVLSSIRALPRVYFGKVGYDKFGEKPIGTGPYKLNKWTRGVLLHLVRNDKHWGTKAKIKNLYFQFSADGDTRANLLATKAVDFAYPIPVQRYRTLALSKTNTVVAKEDRVQMNLFLMGQKTQLADKDLRKAVSLAVNPKAITDSVLLGLGGEPNCTLLTTLLSKPGKASCPTPNVAAAKAIVDAAGNPTITFNYGPAQHTNGEAVAQAIKGQLEAAGFDVNMNSMDYQKMTGDMVGQKLEGIVMYAISPVYPHPNVYAQGFLTSTSITKTCTDSRLSGLAVDALAAKTKTAADAVYKQMETIAISDDHCLFPLYNEIKMWGMSRKLGGFVAPPAVVVDWSKVYWKS